MKFYENGAELAKDMGVPLQTLIDEHDQHYEAAKKTEKDPDGGSYPAYPSGKSWDARSGPTGSGKKFYHIIIPVIHYCMGGLEIDESSRVLDEKRKVIPGLYAAGEVAGGVHGNNRLGGNSLLDCVVFGRVAAEDCAKYMLGDRVKTVDLKQLQSLPPRAGVAPKEGDAPKEAAPAAAAPSKPRGDVVLAVGPDPDSIPGTPYVNMRTGLRFDQDNSAETSNEYGEKLGKIMKWTLAAAVTASFVAIKFF